MSLTLHSILLLDTLTALVTHQLLRKFEPLKPRSLTIALGALIVIPNLFAYALSPHLSSISSSILLSCVIYYGTILGSVGIYRTSSFHTLSPYPGPLICKLTKLWGAWIALTGKTHLYHKSLHKKYGPIVRIGPNELSIIDKGLIPFVIGNQVWDGRRFNQGGDHTEYNSIVDIRDLKEHAHLRKSWNRAFAGDALNNYEKLLLPRVLQLVDQLVKVCKEQPDGVGRVDISQWISFFAFDFMGDMAFGGCFELTRDGDETGIWKSMEAALYLPNITQHVPWLSKFLRAIPSIGDGMKAFTAFGVEHAKKRVNMALPQKDLFYYLVHTFRLRIERLTIILLFNPDRTRRGRVSVSDGAYDTTASALSNALYYLLVNREEFIRLRKEVNRAFSTREIELEKLSSLQFLNAVINETLRLQPPVPTSLQRAPAKGSGGKALGLIFIQEGIAVQIPPYVMHRDPRYFSPHPDEFIPERWISTEGYNTDRAAFIPFSAGPANCAGRSLAMIEMRYVLGYLVKNFDISFDDTYNPRDWEMGLKDRFVLSKGTLPVKLVPITNV